MPLGPRGNAGSAVTRAPVLAWLLAAAVALGRAVLLRGAVRLRGAAAATVTRWRALVAEGLPMVVAHGLLRGGGYVALLGLVVCHVAAMALRLCGWVAAATATKRPAAYYVLKKGVLFLGNTSPLVGGDAAAAAVAAAVAAVAVAVAPPPAPMATFASAELGFMAAELGRRTIEFGKAALQQCTAEEYNITTTATEQVASLWPEFAMTGNVFA